MKKFLKRILASLLVSCLGIVLIPQSLVKFDTQVEASDVSLSKNDDIVGTPYHVTSFKEYGIAPDVKEKIYITNNADGSSQTVSNVVEVNTSNGNAKVVAGYGHLNPTTEGWTMEELTAQASLYENKYNENVVAGINASLFNITTGEPSGVLAMHGVVYKEEYVHDYVAVFDDGSVGIFYKGTSLAQAVEQQSEKQGHEVTLVEAIAGWMVLVENGQMTTNGSNPGYYSRSAIGLKEDGTVVLLQADGTMPPRSLGYTIEEMGYMMKSLGCVMALELDEGGSSTIITQREGEDEIKMRNTPAGGSERNISTSILIVSTAQPSGEFNHASIEPNLEYYTPNTSIALSATGIDSSGALANEIPASVTWQFAEGYENMGELIDASVNGNNAYVTFASNGTLGEVVIQLMNGSELVGTTTLHIQHPDSLEFASDEVNLKYSEITDLGLSAKFEGSIVNLKDGDIEWTISDTSAGTFNGNHFIVTSDKQVSTAAQVTAIYGTLSATTTVNVGKQPTIILDGGDTDPWDYSTIGTTVESFSGMEADDIATYHYAGRGGIVVGSVVSDTDEEYADIVRFGSKAIKLEYDWTGLTGTDGACLGLGSNLDIPGTPTALGVWVYIPENTPVPWLRAQIATSSDGNTWTNAYINFTKGSAEDELAVGWQYLEADLTAYSGMLIRVNSGMLFRAMAGAAAGFGWYTSDGQLLNKSELKGYIIIDNFQIVYGANNQDVTNPTITSIDLINDNGTRTDLENGTTVNSNSVNFYVTYHDNEDTDEFATGIESAYFYLDGSYYGEGTKDNLGSTLAGVELANGEHSLTFYLKDAYGNVTRETRNFVVDNNDSYTNVELEYDSLPYVGKDFTMSLVSNDISNLTSVESTISISSGYNVKSVEFANGVTGTYEYHSVKGILMINVTCDGTQTGNVLATINVEIPTKVVKGQTLNVQVTKGLYEVLNTDCAVNEDKWFKGFSTDRKTLTIQSKYTLEANTLIVGQPAVLSVTENGSAVENINIFLEDGTLLGVTDELGKLTTDAITASQGKYILYACDENNNYSYKETFICFEAMGETADPYNVSTNIAKDLTTEKNLSWMSHATLSSDKAQILLSTSQDMANAETVMGESNLVSYSGSLLINRVNSVYLTNLTPDTTYYYQVGDGTNWSEVKSFATKPTNNETTKFFLLADIQEEDALTGFARIAYYLNCENYDFGIQTGDAVDNVRYYNQWEDALGLFDLISNYDIIHVVGNHESDDDGNHAYATKSIFNLENDWYSVEYGDVYVAVLNHVSDETSLNEFSAWLVEDATSSTCTWKIVVAHVPVYTTNPGGSNALYQNIVSNAVEKAGIDFYFSGDAHSYARTAPLTDLNVDEENGVVYYICGSTGGKSYSVVDVPEYHYEIATIDFESVYLSVNADFDSITIDAYNVDVNGNKSLLDTYTKAIPYCENDEHNYVYNKSDDSLTCQDCPSVIYAKKDMYSGFATDSETGKNMYFIAGKITTGYIQLENDAYFFDNDGLGYEGSFELAKEICYFEDGKFVRSDNTNVIAAGWCGENANFVIYSDGTIKIGGSGELNTSSRENVPWQNYRAFIKKVIFSAEITYISDYAFYDCDALLDIEFEDNSQLSIIGGAAFFSCGVLKEVVLPDGVKTIYGNAFAQCPVLKDVYLPDNVSYISSKAFTNSPKVVLSVAVNSYAKEFAIKNSINYIERSPIELASGKCGANLTWQLMSDGILTINGTGSMDNYRVASHVPWYSYRSSIKKVFIGSGVTTLSDYAFAYCNKLDSVEFATNSELITLGGSVFYECTSLVSITLPDKVMTIYGNTFANCTNLINVYLPDCVSYMSSSVFKNSNNVVLSVASDSYAKDYAETNNIAYVERAIIEIENGKCGESITWSLTSDGTLTISGSGSMTNYKTIDSVPWSKYSGLIKTVKISSNITTLSDYAFAYCINLKNVEFEENSKLTTLGGSVFYGCSNLISVYLPENVNTIYGNSFAKCSSLLGVFLPDSISYISKGVFNYSTKVVLSVGADSYAKEYAIKNNISYTERKIELLASGYCGKNITWELFTNGELNISGKGNMTNYTSYSEVPWYSYRSMIKKVTIDRDITSLGDLAFAYCTNLETIVFEDGSVLITIGGSTFRGCTNLKELVLPENVTTIYGNALSKCTSLTNVYLPKSITYMSPNVYSGSNEVILNVASGSYAEEYAKKNNIKYIVR